jgi:hypothetical protein
MPQRSKPPVKTANAANAIDSPITMPPKRLFDAGAVAAGCALSEVDGAFSFAGWDGSGRRDSGYFTQDELTLGVLIS